MANDLLKDWWKFFVPGEWGKLNKHIATRTLAALPPAQAAELNATIARTEAAEVARIENRLSFLDNLDRFNCPPSITMQDVEGLNSDELQVDKSTNPLNINASEAGVLLRANADYNIYNITTGQANGHNEVEIFNHGGGSTFNFVGSGDVVIQTRVTNVVLPNSPVAEGRKSGLYRGEGGDAYPTSNLYNLGPVRTSIANLAFGNDFRGGEGLNVFTLNAASQVTLSSPAPDQLVVSGSLGYQESRVLGGGEELQIIDGARSISYRLDMLHEVLNLHPDATLRDLITHRDAYIAEVQPWRLEASRARFGIRGPDSIIVAAPLEEPAAPLPFKAPPPNPYATDTSLGPS